jgi:hypothetical protein
MKMTEASVLQKVDERLSKIESGLTGKIDDCVLEAKKFVRSCVTLRTFNHFEMHIQSELNDMRHKQDLMTKQASEVMKRFSNLDQELITEEKFNAFHSDLKYW